MKEIAKGKSNTEAAMVAYDTKNPDVVGANVAKRLEEKFPDVMNRVGGTDEKIAKVVVDAMRAKRTWYSKVKGEYVTEKDHFIRLKATELAAKLKGLTKDDPAASFNMNFMVTTSDISTGGIDDEPIIVEKVAPEADNTP